MNLNRKAVLASILSVLMAAFSLTACGSGGTNTAVSSGSGAAGSEGLTTIRIMGPDPTTSVGNTEVAFSDWVTNGSKMYEKLTGDLAGYGIKLDLNLIPYDQYATVCQTQLATGLDCDFMAVGPLDTLTLLNLVDQGKAQPINQIINKYSTGSAKKFYTDGVGAFSMKLNSLADGNAYWLTTITVADYNGKPTGMSLTFQIRQDWLDKLGLPMPSSLDELYNTLLAFQKKDANGDGSPDEVISVPLDSFGSDIAQWFGLGADTTYVIDETGKVTSPWYQPHVKEYIQFMQKLNKAGLLETSTQESQKTAENKISAVATWSGETWVEPAINLPAGAKPAEFVPIIIKAVADREPLIRMQRGSQNNDSQKYIVTNEAKNPEAIAKLADYLCSDEFNTLSQWGIKDVTYKEENGVRTKINGNPDGDAMFSAAVALWSSDGIFPRYEVGRSRSEELNAVKEAGLAAKAKVAEQTLTYAHTTPQNPASDFAVPTKDEVTRINSITTDLTTYSSELLTKLILEQKSLNDWDSYLSDMKRLGLDELISINQARYDRSK